MKGSTHLIIGVTTYTNYLMLTGKNFDILDIPICLAFSVLPDIDTEASKISKILRNLPMKFILSFIFLSSLGILLYLIFLKNILPYYYIFILPLILIFLKIFNKNKTFKKLSLSLFFLVLYYILLKYTKLGFTKNILLFFAILPYFEHRSFSHSLIGLFTIGIFLFPITFVDTAKNYYYVAILSYFSHLFLGDIFTKKGIKILYPLSKENYSLNIFKSKKIYNNLDIPFIIFYLTITLVLYINLYK